MSQYLNPQTHPPGYDETLAAILHFDLEDLRANQAGNYSERQRARLQKFIPSLRRSLIFGLSFALFMIAAGYNTARTSPSEVVGVVGIGLLCLLLILLFTVISRGRQLADLRGNHLQTSEGNMRVYRSRLSKTASWYLQIGHKSFSITRHQFSQLEDYLEQGASGHRWRVYYPRSMFYQILSVERLM